MGGRRRAPAGDHVGLLDERDREAGGAGHGGDGLEVPRLDAAGGAVAEHERAARRALGGMDVRPGGAVRRRDLDHGALRSTRVSQGRRTCVSPASA